MNATASFYEYDVFLSYSSKDKAIVRPLAHRLRDDGVRVWFDEFIIETGDPIGLMIQKGLQASERVVYCMSPAYFDSDWASLEHQTAFFRDPLNKEHRFIPLLIKKCNPPDVISQFAHIDWRDQSLKEYQRLLRKCTECQLEDDQEKAPKNPSLEVPIGGALDVASPYYIVREADQQVLAGVGAPRGIVTLRGPGQTGKTSMMLRIHEQVASLADPLRSVLISFDAYQDDDFASADSIWKKLAMEIEQQLKLDESWLTSSWQSPRGSIWNLDQFLAQVVFKEDDTPILLCLDGVDQVFGSPIDPAFFKSIRSFHNDGARSNSLWKRVRWLLSSSSEPAFFITDLDNSPFNVGLRVELNSFTVDEVRTLADHLGLTPGKEEVERIMAYLGGRPHLVHTLLYHLAVDPGSSERFFDPATGGNGVFVRCLNKCLRNLQQQPQLAKAMKLILAGKGCKSVEIGERLEAAGLIQPDSTGKEVCSCSLYGDYFKGKI